MAQLEEHGIVPIGLVVCNLYPFGDTVAKPGVTEAEAVEMIDIGGPCMIRASAKNFASVTVITDPSQYGAVLRELRENGCQTALATRRRLALAAFAHTSAYDGAIVEYLSLAL
jgi:phosphoribosylaminoimidazolecarboxamide formyltransferase/IMP cyclohydrolase